MDKKKLIIIIAGSTLGVLLVAGVSYAALQHTKTQKAAKLTALAVPSPIATESPLATPSPTSSTEAAPTPSPKAKPSTTPAKTSPAPDTSPAANPSPSPSPSPVETPSIKHLGVNLDYYNAATGMAGDFKYTKASLHQKRLFMNYAHLVTETSTGSPKRNPQPTFVLPMGTKVRSIVDGKVKSITQLYSGDYGIHITTRDNGKYTYELEHVTNVSVKVGDTVTAGQAVAEVSPHDSNYNDGMGLYEIGILTAGEGSRPRHICPFAYLDSSIKSDLQAKISALYSSWEEYRGDTTLYDEAAMPVPGCETLNPIDE